MFRKIIITITIACLTLTPTLAWEGIIPTAGKVLREGACIIQIALFGSCSPENESALDDLDSGAILDGSGAAKGLKVFEKNYKGNTYGSAIGMVTGWTNFVLPFVSAIAIVALVYAGFLYLTSFGNDEQSGKAKKIIIWVVIGIILIISSYAIVNTLIGTDGSGGDDDDFSLDLDLGGLELSI